MDFTKFGLTDFNPAVVTLPQGTDVLVTDDGSTPIITDSGEEIEVI